MATVDAIGSNQQTTGSSAFSKLSSEDFTRIILQELSKQDPLQPSDTNALIQQLSGIRNIQSSMDLGDKLKSLVSQNEFASATGLIGTTISGISLESSRVHGVVASVSRTSEGAVLTLADSTRVRMSDVDQIEQTPAGTHS